jgi:FAD/FMN-containing dehydrogenase
MSSTEISAIYRSEIDVVAALRDSMQGQVITPFDGQYEEASLAWNRSLVQHPALIVAAENAADVAASVHFARQHGLPVAVQSTGHGATLAADGALLILSGQMKELRVNPEAQTAWIGAGLQWGEVLAKTQEYGLAPLLGSSPGVGVVGYTLGGGLGWLGRKYGLATDSVLTFELVNAESEIIRASQAENADLFWGLRGGGGSFGIISGMEIQLYPVEMVYGGNLLYPIADAREVMRRYREWIRSAPDALTTSVVLMNYPPIPQVPEMLRGKSFVMVRGAYAGPLDEGEALLQSWRDWKTPLMDDFKAMPFREVGRISSDPVNPMPSNGSGGWMRELSDAAIDTLIRYALPQGGPPPLTMVEVRHAGGAINREANPGAFSRRDAELMYFCVGMTPTAEAHEKLGEYLQAMKSELAPALTGGEYINFLHGEEARRRAKDGFSAEAWEKLSQLKAKVDPENVFRFGMEIEGKG